MKEKIIIYQTFPRLFGNTNKKNKKEGTIYDNGSGKMTDYTDKALKSIKELGCNYIWYTGLIQHASKTDYSEYEIATQNKYVVKGEAGSPYAIADYYSVSPDLALDVNKRMKEFDALVKRTHKAGMKVIIDFVPNHVAREYHSNLKPKKIKDLGEKDDKKMAFSADNNFYYIHEQGCAPHLDLGSGDEQYLEFPAKATGDDCFHAFLGFNGWLDRVNLSYG